MFDRLLNKYYYINLQAYNLSVCFQGHSKSLVTFKRPLKEEKSIPFLEKLLPSQMEMVQPYGNALLLSFYYQRNQAIPQRKRLGKKLKDQQGEWHIQRRMRRTILQQQIHGRNNPWMRACSSGDVPCSEARSTSVKSM